jgi:aldehyde:ferredoxin oxidoreductase
MEMDKIWRVNMADRSIKSEPVPAAWAGLGGRGLTSTIVAAEVTATCHPLGPNNKLVFAPGLMAGTVAANSGRLSCGAKSPLTGGIKESNVGGTAGQLLAKLGVKALIIEGIPSDDENKWYGLYVNKDGIRIEEETETIGKGNFETVQILNGRINKRVGVLVLGPAGEMKMLTSNISAKDPESHIRSLGRGGLGAVMGAKKVKFIAVDASGATGMPLADPEKFKAASKIFADALLTHPVSGQGMKTYGTNILVNILHEAGGLPTHGFRLGQYKDHDKISGEFMYDTIVKRHGKPSHSCHPGCLIQCSQVYNDADEKYLTSGMEYETVWALGANGSMTDLDQIAKADNIMDDLGMDSIETTVMFCMCMEGGLVKWGDGDEVLRILTEEIAKGTPLGRLCGGGSELVGKALGVRRIPVVKHQSIPAYDPRSVKGIGITYATTPMGADHTSGYTIATNILGCGGHVDPLKKEGEIDLSRNLQIATAALDSAGMCVFVAFAILDIPTCFPALIDMINARYGTTLTADDIAGLGKYVLKTEHKFNLDAGMTNKDDRLPEFFELERVPPHNAIWDFTPEEIDTFWNF